MKKMLLAIAFVQCILLYVSGQTNPDIGSNINMCFGTTGTQTVSVTNKPYSFIACHRTSGNRSENIVADESCTALISMDSTINLIIK